ncbi:hypothetical protein BGW80DRAFT_1291734, partial [Lactifluus volemus]
MMNGTIRYRVRVCTCAFCDLPSTQKRTPSCSVHRILVVVGVRCSTVVLLQCSAVAQSLGLLSQL